MVLVQIVWVSAYIIQIETGRGARGHLSLKLLPEQRPQFTCGQESPLQITATVNITHEQCLKLEAMSQRAMSEAGRLTGVSLGSPTKKKQATLLFSSIRIELVI